MQPYYYLRIHQAGTCIKRVYYLITSIGQYSPIARPELRNAPTLVLVRLERCLFKCRKGFPARNQTSHLPVRSGSVVTQSLVLIQPCVTAGMDERLGVWLLESLCSDMMQIRLVNKDISTWAERQGRHHLWDTEKRPWVPAIPFAHCPPNLTTRSNRANGSCLMMTWQY